MTFNMSRILVPLRGWGPVILDKSDYFLSPMHSHTGKGLQAPLGMNGRKINSRNFLL